MDANKRSGIYLVRLIVLFFAIYLSLFPTLFSQHNATTFGAFQNYDLTIHFIDVGQGDCTLIELPDKKIMLIDAGPTSASEKVVSYIKDLNIATIDYLLLTHSDEDHSGGMLAIFKNFEVKNIFRPFIASNNSNILDEDDELFLLYDESEICIVTTIAYANFIKYAYKEVYIEDGVEHLSGIFVSYEGDVILSTDSDYPYMIQFHHPPKVGTVNIPSTRTLGYPTKYYGADTNTYSAIISLEYQGEKFLFTGDATKTAETEFLKNLPKQGQVGYERSFAVKNISLLKVAHHGSGASTTNDFLKVVSPKYAVISCGIENSYNHPHPNTLDRLNALWSDGEDMAHIFRTDINGDIIASTNGEGVKFFLEKDFQQMPNKSNQGWVIYVIVVAVVLVLAASIIIRIYQTKKEKVKKEHNPKANSKKAIKKKVKTLLSKPKQRKK